MDDATFTRALASPEPVLCFFHAPWCGPSLFMKTDLYAAMESVPEEVMLAEIDIDECPKAAQQMQVKGLPWMVLVRAGQPLGSQLGTMPPERIVEWVKGLLSPPVTKVKRTKKGWKKDEGDG